MIGHTEVVVIGGGYPGVMAANRLTRRDDVTVTLINPRPTFVERIRLTNWWAGPTTRSSTTEKSWGSASSWWSTL